MNKQLSCRQIFAIICRQLFNRLRASIMKSKCTLSLFAVSSIIAFSGCAESQTMGSTVAKSMGSLVTEVVGGAAEGVRLGLGGAPKENTKTVATSTTSKPGTIPTSDMVYRFGWMEDACTGDQLDFKLLKGQSLSESMNRPEYIGE